MNGSTTGIGGAKRRYAGAQRSSSHIVFARIHIIEVFLSLSIVLPRITRECLHLSLTMASDKIVHKYVGYDQTEIYNTYYDKLLHLLIFYGCDLLPRWQITIGFI